MPGSLISSVSMFSRALAFLSVLLDFRLLFRVGCDFGSSLGEEWKLLTRWFDIWLPEPVDCVSTR